MEKDWVVAYYASQTFQAEMIRKMLSDHEIEVFIINKQDSSYHIGEIELYVKRDNVVRAKKLIKDFEN